MRTFLAAVCVLVTVSIPTSAGAQSLADDMWFLNNYNSTNCTGSGGTWSGMSCDGGSSGVWAARRQLEREIWQLRRQRWLKKMEERAIKMEAEAATFLKALGKVLADGSYEKLRFGSLDPSVILADNVPDTYYQCLRGRLLQVAFGEITPNQAHLTYTPFQRQMSAENMRAASRRRAAEWASYFVALQVQDEGYEQIDLYDPYHRKLFTNLMRREFILMFAETPKLLDSIDYAQEPVSTHNDILTVTRMNPEDSECDIAKSSWVIIDGKRVDTVLPRRSEVLVNSLSFRGLSSFDLTK